MSPYSPSLPRSWRSSDENTSPTVRRRDRFLAALDQAPVEALCTVFLEDLLARPLEKEEKTGGLWDRQGTRWLVFDVDDTKARCPPTCFALYTGSATSTASVG